MQLKMALGLISLLFIAGCLSSDDNCPPDTDCRDYSSSYEAQLAYDLDPGCKGDLDADNDGRACEESEWEDYYNSNNGSTGNTGNSGCPNTAACGCSNKNKAACESSVCCKWTTGEGCGCK